MAATYNLVEYDSDEERHLHPEGPDVLNLISAAGFLAGLFRRFDLPYAILGGFALLLRGSDRPTWDVDMVVQASMQDIWRAIENETRMIIPSSRQLDGLIRVFVKTGPGYDDCGEAFDVGVDLIQAGSKRTPRSLVSERDILRVPQSLMTQNMVFLGLSILYMMKTKLGACADRQLDRDYQDVTFLNRKYSAEIGAHLNFFDEDELETYFDGLSEDRMREIKHLLRID